MERYTVSPYDSSNSYKVTYKEGDQSIERYEQSAIMNSNVKVHVVKDGDTLSGISNHYYGDPGYWDRIGVANDIYNPFDEEEFYSGLRIIIPDINNVIYY